MKCLYLEQGEGGPQSSQSPDSGSSESYSYVSTPACLLLLASSVSYLGALAGWSSLMKLSNSSLLRGWNASGSGTAKQQLVKIQRIDQWWQPPPLRVFQGFIVFSPWYSLSCWRWETWSKTESTSWYVSTPEQILSNATLINKLSTCVPLCTCVYQFMCLFSPFDGFKFRLLKSTSRFLI